MEDGKGITIASLTNDSAYAILSKELYEKEAVFAALYRFENKCFIKVAPEGDTQFRVDILSRDGESLSEEELTALLNEFMNELIDQQIRRDLEQQFGRVRDLIVEHAFAPIRNLEQRINENV